MEEKPADEVEHAAKRALEDARVIFSAMIYGYRFRYVPSERARGIPEQCTLEAIAEIPWGDAGMSVQSTQVQEKMLHVKVQYTLTEFQFRRREAWGSNAVPLAAGIGTGDLFQGPQAKLTALQDAFRESVRSYLRSRTLSRPREVTGELLLWESPYTVIQEGAYVTRVKIKLFIRESVPYRIF